MTKLKILDARDFGRKTIVSVQKTGRLVFNRNACSILNLDIHRGIKFAIDEDKKDLYIITCSKNCDDAFPLKDGNSYQYILSRNLFDYLGIDYKNRRASFELSRVTSYDVTLGGTAYKAKIIITNKHKKYEDKIKSA